MKKHEIWIENEKIEILPNLDGALRQLRSLDEQRLLWVDAICIHQDDVTERSNQVRIMQDIYSSAKSVLIWLGETQSADLSAFETISRLKRFPKQFGDRSWFPISLAWHYDKQKKKMVSGGIETNKSASAANFEYESLVKMLDRPWFRRTWIIQEAASAKRAYVLCGNATITWEVLADVYLKFGDSFLPIDQPGGDHARQALESIIAIETTRRSQSGPLSMSLLQILISTSYGGCSDERDRIFAVMGLAKGWSGKNTHWPDYHESVEDLFKEFAVAESHLSGTLNALSCASGPSDLKGSLPSWVPDWRKIDNAHPFIRYSDRTKFCASGGMKAVAWHSDNENILHVEGKLIDFIDEIGPQSRFTKAIAAFDINHRKILQIQQSREYLLECEAMARKQEDGTSIAKRDELWRTLTCGLTREAFPAPSRYREYFDNYLEFLRTTPDFMLKWMSEKHSTAHFVEKLFPQWDKHTLIESAIHKWSSKRRFVTTVIDRLACVPMNAQKDDAICILFGAEVPYVLRRRADGCYSVIGECYVDDIMHGEALSHDTMSREFRLR